MRNKQYSSVYDAYEVDKKREGAMKRYCGRGFEKEQKRKRKGK